MFNIDLFATVNNNNITTKKWINSYGGLIIQSEYNPKTGKITKKIINKKNK